MLLTTQSLKAIASLPASTIVETVANNTAIRSGETDLYALPYPQTYVSVDLYIYT